MSQGISWPALNQTVCALRFFYGVTCDRAEIPEWIADARTPRKLPTILSADEVVRFLEAVPSLKRIDLRKREPARERHLEGPVIRAGRLIHDAGNWRLAEQFYEGPNPPERSFQTAAQPGLPAEMRRDGFLKCRCRWYALSP